MDFDKDLNTFIKYLDHLPNKTGVQSLLHQLLEEGSFVQPILDFFGDELEVERKDPQGWTLFLAACRSELGLDARTNCDYWKDLYHVPLYA